jgi:hypothetical protein
MRSLDSYIRGFGENSVQILNPLLELGDFY